MAVRVHVAWKIAALGGVLAFLVLVWPTPYRYDRLTVGPASFPVRINRVTGSTQILEPGGWQKAPKPRHEELLPIGALEKIRLGQANWSSQQLRFQLYNGSDYSLSEVTLKVTAYPEPSDGSFDPCALGATPIEGPACRASSPTPGVKARAVRLYRADAIATSEPLQNGSFRVDLGFPMGCGEAIACQIVAARGSRGR